MAFTMTTDLSISQKVGAGVSATFDNAYRESAELRAASTINCVCRFNYTDALTTGVNADVKGILSDVASSLVAIEAIAYDMSGYTSRTEAEDMINVLRDGALRGLSILKDKKVQEFINNA